jgi:hypothetical protein
LSNKPSSTIWSYSERFNGRTSAGSIERASELDMVQIYHGHLRRAMPDLGEHRRCRGIKA